MADDMIGYDTLMQDALRGVVRAALQEAASPRGLPGKHHFYITFRTHAPGVVIPEHLRARYPDEMTIVIQNRFWDLKVGEDHFEVGLSFNQAPANLSIPFAAITNFHDPEVNFQLAFQAHDDDPAPDALDHGENDPPAATPIEDGSNVVAVDFKRKK